jgi:hypothetical protein
VTTTNQLPQRELPLLIAEVQQLAADVRQLIALTPCRTKTWLQPRELAPMLGVSTRTLGAWRTSGRFRSQSIRKGAKGWEFHFELAVKDAQALRQEVG